MWSSIKPLSFMYMKKKSVQGNDDHNVSLAILPYHKKDEIGIILDINLGEMAFLFSKNEDANLFAKYRNLRIWWRWLNVSHSFFSIPFAFWHNMRNITEIKNKMTKLVENKTTTILHTRELPFSLSLSPSLSRQLFVGKSVKWSIMSNEKKKFDLTWLALHMCRDATCTFTLHATQHSVEFTFPFIVSSGSYSTAS